RAELIANGMTIEEIRASLGADSLGYISTEGMIAATAVPEERLCTACFTGRYPVPVEDAADDVEHARGGYQLLPPRNPQALTIAGAQSGARAVPPSATPRPASAPRRGTAPSSA